MEKSEKKHLQQVDNKRFANASLKERFQETIRIIKLIRQQQEKNHDTPMPL